MKKLTALILAAALLVAVLLLPPLVSLADESDYVGCWASYDHLTTGAPAMSMLYLAEDHTCYFVIQSFDPDEPGLGRAHVGTWELQSDGTLVAKTGNNTKTRLRFQSGGNSLALDDALRVYVNITPFTLR